MKSENSAFSTILGHTFADPSLLQAALTHPSLSKGTGQKSSSGAPYERLEFLGDRVLGLVIAEWLYELFPKAKEGELAKRHAAMVNRDALHDVAVEIKLDQFLRLAHGEEPGVGRKNLVVLSDAMEAVIGALYLDAKISFVQGFIRNHWAGIIQAAAAPPVDPKTALQEWAQGHGLPLPAYKILDRSGPAHAPVFVIEVSLPGYEPATAQGASKRQAEKDAAKALLHTINKNKN